MYTLQTVGDCHQTAALRRFTKASLFSAWKGMVEMLSETSWTGRNDKDNTS